MRCRGWMGAALIGACLLGGAGELARAGDDARPGGPATAGQPTAPKVDDLIRDLGSDDFKTREAATDALGARGAEAIPALEKAAQDKDPEVRWRAEKALKAARAKAGAPQPGPRTGAGETGRDEDAARPPTGPRDPSEDALREMERGMRGGIKDLLKELRPQGMDKDFERAFDEMEKSLRELERNGFTAPGPQGPQRDFWTFKLKDGQWQIERGGRSPAQRVGIRTTPLPPVARAQLVLTDDAVVVEEVRPDSLAEKAGFERYDIVFTVDGHPTRTDEDLDALAEPGEHRVEILRAGKRQTLRLPGEAAPPAAPPPAAPGSRPGEGKVRKY